MYHPHIAYLDSVDLFSLRQLAQVLAVILCPLRRAFQCNVKLLADRNFVHKALLAGTISHIRFAVNWQLTVMRICDKILPSNECTRAAVNSRVRDTARSTCHAERIYRIHYTPPTSLVGHDPTWSAAQDDVPHAT